jgi:Spy/CpxP family protein refolding chaperone
MMALRGLLQGCLLALALALAAEAAADDPAAARPGPPAAERPGLSVQERGLQGILTIHNWKMTEAVGLTQAQAARLFPAMHEAFQARWQAAGKRKELLRRLERVSEAAPPRQDRLEELLAAWRENERRLADSRREMEEAVRTVLSPMQQVTYLRFQERFYGDLTRLLQEVRREQSRAAGRRPDRGE